MTVQEAIELLTGLGYTVAKPEGNPFMTHGEAWEQDSKAYKAAWETDKQKYSDLLDEVDYAEMVADWSTDTLIQVWSGGTYLAHNPEQYKAINQAARAEWESRQTAQSRPTNGMVE